MTTPCFGSRSRHESASIVRPRSPRESAQSPPRGLFDGLLGCRFVSPRRLRRAPEEARAEILLAAEAALQDVELSALTVELLMERTGMTRSSFYHYFKSLDDIAIALFERIEAEVSGAVDSWLSVDERTLNPAPDPDHDPRAATVESLTRMFEVWRRHATLMRAMEHAAGRSGAAYDQWRGRVVDGYIARTADFIRAQVAAGRSQVSDPEAIANALILMNVAVATDQALRDESASPEQLGATVGAIWNATLYGN